MSRPQAILFDALGTLVALEPPTPRLRAELARRFGIDVSEEQAAEAISAEIAYYRGHFDEGRDAQTLADLRRRCAETLRATLPTSLSNVDGAAVTDALLVSLRFSVYPDVVPTLTRWRSRGATLVVVSNWDVSLHQVLARVGLAPFLDGILTSAEAGARKPSPAIFDRALEMAGAVPEDSMHVGDSLEEDVAGARAAGIDAVLVLRDGGAPVPGVRTIASLAELDA